MHKTQAKQQEAWLAENKAAIVAYNQAVDEGGAFGDTLRMFLTGEAFNCAIFGLSR